LLRPDKFNLDAVSLESLCGQAQDLKIIEDAIR
jgi:hypothetical protein